MSDLGPLIATGRTSEVFATGTGNVVKVPRPGVPPHWARVEASITGAIHQAGAPCPAVRGLVDVNGRESIVFERIDGPSLWEVMVTEPSAMADHVAILVELQRTIHRVCANPPVPRLSDRIGSKILAADGLGEVERRRAATLAATLPDGSALCHGDLHPANVLLSEDGPVVIDWFDAAAGSPTADLVRTSLLIRPLSRGRDVAHLRGAEPEVLTSLHHHYIDQAVGELLDADPGDAGRSTGTPLADELLCWERVLAAGRLAEHTTADRSDLLALLQAEDGDGSCSILAQALAERRRRH